MAPPWEAGQHLVEVHDHYRAELTQLRDVLEQVRDGNRDAGSARSALNEMAVRANTWVLGSVCQTYCLALTQHHSMEDAAVFPHLAAQDDGLAAVIARLGDEHVAIHELLEAVDRSLVDLVQKPDDLTAVDEAVERAVRCPAVALRLRGARAGRPAQPARLLPRPALTRVSGSAARAAAARSPAARRGAARPRTTRA